MLENGSSMWKGIWHPIQANIAANYKTICDWDIMHQQHELLIRSNE